MASKQGDVHDSGSDDDTKRGQGEQSDDKKSKGGFMAFAAKTMRNVKRKISPKKPKDEPLVHIPTPSPPPGEDSDLSPATPPSPKDPNDYVHSVSSQVTEFMTDTTSLNNPSCSDSLVGMPEIALERRLPPCSAERKAEVFKIQRAASGEQEDTKQPPRSGRKSE